ncbi:MAG: DUF401 family protein [Bacillota bacterium]
MIDLLKIAALFAAIILLMRLKISLGPAILAASVLLVAEYRIGGGQAIGTALAAATSSQTLLLVAALYLIMLLEKVMTDRGMLQLTVDTMKELLPDYRPVLAIMPALIGLLPSAGGAALSAPLVETVASGYDVSPEKKSFINYWYRHICEYVFPLYPALILGSVLLEVPITLLIRSLFPGTLVGILTGVLVALSTLPRPLANDRMTGEQRKRALLSLLWNVWPIMAVVALTLVAGIHLAISLGIVVLVLLVINRYSGTKVLVLAREAFSWNIIVLIVAIMVFKEMISVSGAFENLALYFQNNRLNPVLIALTLPFMIGLLTGFSPASVGLSYPLIMNLVGAGPEAVKLGAIAYASGFAGVLLSPVHLCLVYTVEYFCADLGKVYRLLSLPVLGSLCAIIVWNLLLL